MVGWEDDGKEDVLMGAMPKMEENEVKIEELSPVNASVSGVQVGRVVAELGPTAVESELSGF